MFSSMSSIKKNTTKETQKGFSLFELMVVIGLIVLLAGVIFSQGTSSNAKLRSATSALTDTLKEVRQMSLSVKEYHDSDTFPNYGVEFDLGNPTEVRVYADCKADDNNSGIFDGSDRFTYDATNQYPGLQTSCSTAGTPPAPQNGLIEDRTLLHGTKITAIRLYDGQNAIVPGVTPTRAYVEYFRPEPTTWIAFNDAGNQGILSVGHLEVDISDASGTNKKTISISTVGQIMLQ
jgi:prepilin-type N-terminal cleavage/methylation domain-containing protein